METCLLGANLSTGSLNLRSGSLRKDNLVQNLGRGTMLANKRSVAYVSAVHHYVRIVNCFLYETAILAHIIVDCRRGRRMRKQAVFLKQV